MDEKVKDDSTNQKIETTAPEVPVEKAAQPVSQEAPADASTASDSASDATSAEESTPSASAETHQEGGNGASEEKKEEHSSAAVETSAKKAEKPVPPKHKLTIIDVFLVVTGVLFLFCAYGMTVPDFMNVARIAGLILVFVFVSGAFYATLHLKKVG